MGSTSGAAILATLIPVFVTACIYMGAFAAIRNRNRKIYAPRTFLVPEKDRTPQSTAEGKSWFHDFRALSDHFVLQHNSLDAYLYLRFLKFIIFICFVGSCVTWSILLPINATGGGNATQLDRFTIGNVKKTGHLWAHVVVAWVGFCAVLALIARERLLLVGTRQAYLLDEKRGARLSRRTVLFLNASPDACQPENLRQYFGNEAEKAWPVTDTGDLEDLIGRRNGTAFALESAEVDLIINAVKHQKSHGRSMNGNGSSAIERGRSDVPNSARPTARKPVAVGDKFDLIERSRKMVAELEEKIKASRSAPSRNFPEHSAIFVAFSTQAAAHRAFQHISFPPPMPVEDRFLNVQPKEVLWKNLAMPTTVRLSKASLALAFVVVFTIFFSIPVGIIATFSQPKNLADNVSWLSWLNDLPPAVLGLLTGLVPPYLTSWFVSYVPKLFRLIAKYSGEPTTSQAELKTQVWYFVFQVSQVFLITALSSGAADVVYKIIKDPQDAPALLAQGLPKSSNFYLTYFLLQGIAKSADTVLNYSDLFEYLFYEKFWDKTPRAKFGTYSQMKGTPWASWYPKFTNFLVIGMVYACIAPLVLGFAAIGIAIYYFAYRYQLLYVCQTKVDTKGEAYKRALQQMPTGIYLAELSLIGLMGANEAPVQAALMIVLLVITAAANLVLDRVMRPLELYLGVDSWKEEETPTYAEEEGIPETDHAALHAASHGRRLGIGRLPHPAPRYLSDFFDKIICSARYQVESWMDEIEDDAEHLKGEALDKAYIAPAMTSKTPKLWIPRDVFGVSKQEIEQNEVDGITTTDENAEIDDDGRLQWDHRLENVPIYSKSKAI